MNEVIIGSITVKDLFLNKWVQTSDPVYPFTKRIVNTNPLNASEDTDMKLVVHGLYNEWCFAIVLPDGSLLNFTATTLKELDSFEQQIKFYDPQF